jgi:hypothetical protein
MISAIQSYSGTVCNNKQQINFGSIHPTRYFVKWDDGYYYQATTSDIIKKLQRQVVSLLNKNINNKRRGIQPPAKPSKAWKKKNALVERLSAFFARRDSDYARHNEVRAFSRYNDNHKPDSYILSGRHIVITEDEAKKIGRVQRKTNEQAEMISDNLGISYEEAKKNINPETMAEIRVVKADYFDNVEAQIRQVLATHDSANSPFDAYFVAKKKGDEYIYELVDAKINGK